MLLIYRKVLFLVGLTLYVICAHSHTVTSTRNGVWTDPATWVGGVVPTSVTATQIIIDHEVDLDEAATVSVFRVVVNNKLTLKSSATLNVSEDGLPDIPDLQVYGTFVMEDGSFCNGTSSINTRFEAGSFYTHQQGPLGFIPYATWDGNSTFIINGFKASGYINIAHSDSWKQTFGNVVYNCPEQSSFVDLNGYLRNIQGDFTIIHTRNQALRLSTTQNPVISIGGNLRIEGPSQVWMSTNGNSASVNILGDFSYTSTSLCYLTTRGRISVLVGGNLSINTSSVIRMTSLSDDSVGIREASLNVRQGLSISSGVIAAPPAGNGKGTITFDGVGLQPVSTAINGESFLGNLDFVIETNAVVSLGNSVLSNTSGSLLVKGTLQLGSSDPLGAIQLANNGNIRIQGLRTFEPGSTIEYNGTGPQYIGDGHPTSPGVHLICSNGSTVSMLNDLVSVNDFSVQSGSFLAGIYAIEVQGDLTLDPSATIVVPSVRFSGNQDQAVSAAGKRLTNVNINKTDGTAITLTSPLIIDGLLQIESANTDFQSNGFLTLASSSDNAAGTASVGPLPAGSSISGDVTAERFMSGEGRIYRYISSPVANTTVADLMDDFAITGSFADPSSGPGINSPAPSFYYYDESVGGLQAGWKPYPTSGLANTNFLQPGRGYAAFIRNGTGSTTWDVNGILNQGDIELPVDFTPNGAPSNGWNLIGNPYACTIDWDITGPTGWTKQNISQVISIRDNGAAGGTFRYWDGDINYSDIPDGQIATGQSIWVRATGTNPSLIIREGVKVPNSAAFYREAALGIPSFAVVITRDGLNDKAFFKIRQGATSGLDDWDAVKQENDNFDIATFSDDGIPLAINAQEKLPCQTEQIQLDIKDLKQGEYEIELITKYDFEQFTYTWIDRYLNVETIIGADKKINFSVTSDDASGATDRFLIRLEEPAISDSISVVVPPVLCATQHAFAIIHFSQPGIYYSLWDEKGTRVSFEQLGTGADLHVELLLDSISNGQSLLHVVARSACNRRELNSWYQVHKAPLPLLSVKSSRQCMDNPVELTASSDQEVIRYSWFEDENSQDTLSTSEKFVTPSLMKPKTYYVSAVSSEGCTTSRLAVRADVITYDSARISWIDGSTISSSYQASNTWYRDGNVLEGEHNQTLTLTQPGIYTLEVDTMGCITRDSVEFLTTESIAEMEKYIAVFPNPAKEKLHVQSYCSGSFNLEIRNAVGMVVWKANDVNASTIDVTSLSAGIYFAFIYQQGLERVVRFVKCE